VGICARKWSVRRTSRVHPLLCRDALPNGIKIPFEVRTQRNEGMEDNRHEALSNCVVTFTQQLQDNVTFCSVAVFTTVTAAPTHCYGIYILRNMTPFLVTNLRHN
jgi:hypothetical protein